ncbi:MAG TPA: GxxExxY protein [Longimicrobium sp.]|uniref:GxxExxY protein n=1 Tax=Longimicrobium sp. TaxID=2029185 RepID=UPI002ED923D8
MPGRDEVTGIIVDAAYRLHTRIGPGLLENVYEAILAKMLADRGLEIERQKPISFVIDGIHFQDGFRVDLLVERRIVVEIKAIQKLAPVHSKQLLSYLRLMDLQVGLLINFGEERLKEGLHRVVNRYHPQ